ncbi:UrcA family protein [Novosphingobium sp. Gsoil 351]|uniref:UrcA family protein n=1 Tax=Novosphingobium sp. Gsoil 351 TaxID=2675225 RepID=UPI0018A8233C|nr:UrcA family protein [Novosphingobium sp. Gsoil 351]
MKAIVRMTIVVLAISAAGAQARQASSPVAYKDLDLSSGHGRAILKGRINQAIDQVCGRPISYDPPVNNAIARCRRETERQARDDVNKVVARSSQQFDERLAGKR